MKKYIAPKVKVRKVIFPTILAGSVSDSVKVETEAEAEDNSEGLSKGSMSWFGEDGY